MTPVYELCDLRVRLGESEILHGLSVEFGESSLTAIVGPNGAGKSTLMSVLAGVRETYGGSCLFRGREVSRWVKRDLARQTAFIPQMIRLEFPFTAQQVVFMGRTPYCHGLFESPDDEAAVRRAMALTDSLPFAQREYRALSGGEKQRVVLASALAQDPSVLLLDEPTTFLDLKHQVATYALLQSLAGKGMAVIAVTHDLNLAASYADRIVVLSRGRIAADGKPANVLQARLLREVFEVDLEIREGPAGKPWVFYEQAASSSSSPEDQGHNAPLC
jgi:iron complex transport system ATP-binding protein